MSLSVRPSFVWLNITAAALPGKHFFLPLHSFPLSLPLASSLHFFWMGWDLGRGRGEEEEEEEKPEERAQAISAAALPSPPSFFPAFLGRFHAQGA